MGNSCCGKDGSPTTDADRNMLPSQTKKDPNSLVNTTTDGIDDEKSV